MIICNDCGLEKPSSEYGKNRQKKNGLMSRCRICVYQRSTTWRKKNRKRDLANAQKRRANNPEKHKQYQKNHYYNPENIERIIELRKINYERNREKILKANKKYRKKNREKVKEYHKNYRLNNLGKYTAKSRKYTLQKQQAMLRSLTDEQIKEIESFYIIAQELTTKSGIPHQVDHIIPLQGKNICGLHVPWNLQVITASANRKKSNI